MDFTSQITPRTSHAQKLPRVTNLLRIHPSRSTSTLALNFSQHIDFARIALCILCSSKLDYLEYTLFNMRTVFVGTPASNFAKIVLQAKNKLSWPYSAQESKSKK